MLNKNRKRCLSLILALVMVFSMLPVSTLAEETEPTETTPEETIVTDPTVTSQPEESSEPTGKTEESSEPTEESSEPTVGAGLPEGPQTTDPTEETEAAPNPLLAQYQESINYILDTYLGARDLPMDEIRAKVAVMEFAFYQEARYEIYLLNEEILADYDGGNISEAEIEELAAANEIFCAFSNVLDEHAANDDTVSNLAFTDKTTFFDGTLSFSIENSNNDASTPFATVTADSAVKGTARNPRDWSSSTATATIRMTNKCGKNATLYFTYNFTVEGNGTIAVTSTGSLTDSSGSTTDNTGDCSVMLENNGYVDVKITSSGSVKCYDNYVNITAISLVPAADAANVTINYDEALGSVTANGTAVGSDEAVTADSSGMTLVANPASGTSFLGWTDTNNKVLSTASTYEFAPSGDVTLKAIFASTTPWYIVDSGAYLVDDWNKAMGYGGTVVLANNATLPADDYTIPSGVTLLIPKDSNHTVYTTAPEIVEGNDYWSSPAAITSYRKLTMAAGASIIVEEKGAISVAGTHKAGGLYAAVTCGANGFINMNSNSSITVKSGGFLYAWGCITGSGNITIKSGGTVYENFQVCDWRGGDVTTQMNSSAETYGVFPMSQYYVQNIEVPLRLDAGAIENTLMTVSISIIGVQNAPVPFMGGSGTMFNISSGYLIKDYSESEDRMVITMYPDSSTGKGELIISPSSITMKLGVFGNTTLATENYELPLTNNLRVTATSGTTITLAQDVAILPGAEIIIGEGAACNLSSGTSLYLYDKDQWGGYCGAGNSQMIVLPNAPGRTGSRSALVDAQLKINGTLDASAGYIYTTTDGANICSDGSGVIKTQAGTQTVTYQVTHADPPTYNEISITPAQLKNSDGTFLQSVSDTYTYIDGFWRCANHAYNDGVKTPATCTEAGYTTYTCTICSHSYTGDTVTALGHTAGSAATCTTAQTCTVCGAEIVAALGHTEVVDAAVAATCTETGLTEGKHCSVCNEVLVAQETVNAKGHTAGDVVVEKKVDATCTAAGSYDNVTYCTACGEETSRETITVDALGHSYNDGVVTTDPTCTAEGVKTYTCGTCGDSYTEEIPATGHNFDDETDKCKVCNAVALATLEALALSADAEVLLIMRMSISEDILNDTGAQVIVTEEANTITQGATVTTYTMDQVRTLLDKSGRYAFKTGIASGEMTGEVTLQIKDGKGNYIYIDDYKSDKDTTSVTRTVADYIKLALASNNEDLKKLITSLAVYGGYAQVNFNTHTDALVYNVLGDAATEGSDFASSYIAGVTAGSIAEDLSISGSDIGIKYISQNLGLDSKIYTGILFELKEGANIGDYSFTVTYPGGGSAKATPEADDGGYRIYIRDIPAAYLDNMYTITVTKTNAADTQAEGTEAEVTEEYVVKASATTYIKTCLTEYGSSADEKMIKLVNLVKAMYLYNQAANEYFGK